MSSSRPVFRSRWLPYVLVAPQLIITLIFFIWPAGEALWYSLQSVDPFGLSSQFVGLDNFVALFHDPYYLDSFWTTIKFSALVTVSGLLISLFFAALVDYVVRGSRFYQTLMLLPYAVAPAVAAVLWIFLFNPGRGLITHFLGELGYDWNHAQNSGQAMFLVVFASVWKQISYNFLFFFAALQSIPRSLVEAAAIDGAGPIRRFFKLALPLIAPVSFFLLVVNLVYAFFDTFPVIDAATAGGPVQATTTLIYKIYREGFAGLDLSAYAPHTPMSELSTELSQTQVARFADKTVGDVLGDWHAHGVGARPIVGTPEQVADRMIELADGADLDGFLFAPVIPPASTVDFIEHVLPILKERGAIVEPSSEPQSLRERLIGTPTPALADSHTGSQYRRTMSRV